MQIYMDSSVLLRILFEEPTALKDLSGMQGAVSSELLRVECLRTIDRIRIRKQLPDAMYLQYTQRFFQFLEHIELIPLQREILNRACQPFSITLGTLDAIHLASAILFRERLAQGLVLATHDKQLGAGGLALGFQVLGVE